MKSTLQKAITYHQQGKLSQAQGIYQKLIQKERDNADAWHLLGVLFYQMGEADIAQNNIQKAIELNPNVASFHSNLGLVFHQKMYFDKAVESYRKALALQPEYPEAWNNLGNALKEKGVKHSPEHQEALECYQKALALHPVYADAMNNLANMLSDYGKIEEATHYYEAALRINPNYKEALANYGIHANREGEAGKAAALFQRVLGLPGQTNPLALSTLFECYRDMCAWEAAEAVEKELVAKSLDESDPTLIDPFVTIAKLTTVSKEDQLRLIRKYVSAHIIKDRKFRPFNHTRSEDGKIRLGYVSADLHDHATMHLIQGLFSRHDREDFEVTLFALKSDKSSPYYQRVQAGVDSVVDLSMMNDEAAAKAIYANGIDILIDINGLTKNARTAIFAYRPAPVQVQYLAYPGTMGCDFIDYIITDETITPVTDEPFFSEKFLYMPECYQVNDRDQKIEDNIPSRHDCGLPEDAFVYCLFNSLYKIEPVIFGIWMEILNETENSVLWLMGGNKEAEDNLRSEAQKRGVDPSRLIFAAKLPKAAHLARLKNADLVLDTYFCNAHTTASDALYAGIPLITCKGDRMANRVASSILEGIGLEECVTTSHAEYRSLALELYKDQQQLKRIVMKLEKNKTAYPLFKTDIFARHMDKGLQMIWKNYLAGHEPMTTKVEEEVLS